MKSILTNAIISLALITVGIFTYHSLSKEKIGYVKTGVILQKYQAMIDANKQFATELSIVQSNADTLRNRVEYLKSQEKNIKPTEKASWGYQLGIAEKEFMQYSEAADKQLQQRQQQLTAEVLNKINSYIQEYGKENGYKIIFGTTSEGNILYGEEGDDLTDEVVGELNENYKSSTNNKESSK